MQYGAYQYTAQGLICYPVREMELYGCGARVINHHSSTHIEWMMVTTISVILRENT